MKRAPPFDKNFGYEAGDGEPLKGSIGGISCNRIAHAKRAQLPQTKTPT
ncbi:MAG: hypothetical protein SGJ27_06875 [Candidatus Melainabacteria bacterium]|nr:hypothetical protein [Candidatus Melainabacteria bacterium]